MNLMQLGKLEPPVIDGLNIARLRHIVREPLPEDGVSGQFDYSPARIERLMAQGRAAAAKALTDGGESAGGGEPVAEPPAAPVALHGQRAVPVRQQPATTAASEPAAGSSRSSV